MPRTLVPNAAAGSLTTWGTRSGVEQKVGRDNLAHYADLNNNEDAGEITAAIADDLTEAATDMATAWREFTGTVLGSSNAIEARWLADTNEYGAAVKAWDGRTIDAPQGEDVPQQIGTAKDEWARRLAALRGGTVLLDYQGDEAEVTPTAALAALRTLAPASGRLTYAQDVARLQPGKDYTLASLIAGGWPHYMSN